MIEVVLAADAVVFHEDAESGGVSLLLIQRQDDGKWALPGGCVDVEVYEPVEGTCERELAEETGLVIPFESNNWIPQPVRAHPDRDHRGRYVSFPFAILLTGPRPPVRGADDALMAAWLPLHEVNVDELAFDHGEIVRTASKSFSLKFLTLGLGLA